MSDGEISLYSFLVKMLKLWWRKLFEIASRNDIPMIAYQLEDLPVQEWEINTNKEVNVVEVIIIGDDSVTSIGLSPFKQDELVGPPVSVSLTVTEVDSKIQNRMIEVNFFQQINEYCEMSNEPHRPINEELCLAKLGSEWQRAECIKSKTDGKLLMNFIDSGCIAYVSHFNIRRMVAEFIMYPCLAYVCTIHGVDPRRINDYRKLADKSIKIKVLEYLDKILYKVSIENLD